jgi:hypothetical protein
MKYVRGVAEIVFARPLTMAEEWARDHRWVDWTGKAFGGRDEWDYVWSQPAVEKVLPSGAVCDQGHGGMVLAGFRQLYVERVAAAGGDDELVPTLEEVAAARLYTGPAYVKLNGFMRLVGKVKTRHWRARFAQLESFTYSSTVHHLINAIRKITQIDALEQQRLEEEGAMGEGEEQVAAELTLYRGVRGVLPASFFEPDVQGFVTAVDFGFTSTSAERAVPIGFMSSDEYNVLWVMHCNSGADSTGQLHNGAVLQALSQFPVPSGGGDAAAAAVHVAGAPQRQQGGYNGCLMDPRQGAVNKKGETVRFKEIHVRPCFVLRLKADSR